MTCRHFKPAYQKLIFFVFACLLPLAANSTMEEVIDEKHIEVGMRMIGHEVLLCLGDRESRIMPIEKIEKANKPDSYRIPFEFEFGFDPDDIVSIVERVMKENSVANDYLVEVEQCETKEVVHSFEIRSTANPDLIPCRGRVLPKDCYSLIITILDGHIDTLAEELSADGLTKTLSETKASNLFKSASLIIPLLFLIGFIGYSVKNKKPSELDPSESQTSLAADIDPNLIMIGASLFDKRNMALSFDNKSVELSNKEAELLSLLHSSANAPLEREVILQKVWGDEGDYVGRTVDVFISKLRKKLEADASVKIVNIRGVGYKLVMDVSR